MMPADRSAQITKILQAISVGDTATINTELEIYIADLETEKSDRPARITAILNTISAQYPADMGVPLEDYIAHLEEGQQVVWSESHQTPSADAERPAIWSHQRKVERAHHRTERAARKQNSY